MPPQELVPYAQRVVRVMGAAALYIYHSKVFRISVSAWIDSSLTVDSDGNIMSAAQREKQNNRYKVVHFIMQN